MEAEQKEDRLVFANLPQVTELQDTKTRQRIIALLELLDQMVEKRAKLEAVEEDCKSELEALQTATNKTGFKYGLLCFISQPTKGRKTLDKYLLMEHGVSAKTIQASYKEGAPGTRKTFKRLPEAE